MYVIYGLWIMSNAGYGICSMLCKHIPEQKCMHLSMNVYPEGRKGSRRFDMLFFSPQRAKHMYIYLRKKRYSSVKQKKKSF